jgi:energy-coupling factor transporter ATP-binding protein EcfA2
MSPSSNVARYEAPEVLELLRLLQEATRATPMGGPSTYVPPTGGEIAEANYHHFIFGQRGSGKSSLLRHLQRQMLRQRRAAVWIDQEIFSNLSYPDVLVSAVCELIKGVAEALQRRDELQPSTGLRRTLRGRRNTTPQRQLLNELSQAISELQILKFTALDRKIEWQVTDATNSTSGAKAGVRMELVTLEGSLSASQHSTSTRKELVEGTKEQYLERALTGFRDLLIRTSSEVNGGFVFIDDLYHLRREDQPLVLGYLHRLVKDTNLWLKIGSIRYSTVTFRPGDPPRGMQSGQDAHEVPLDRGLRYFQSTQDFLEKILSRIADQVEVNIYDLITDDARKRLVLAAGGVARDYLRLISEAINEARNRGVTEKTGSHRIIVEDINKAAGRLSPAKFDDLRKDEPEEASALEGLVRRLTDFCRARKKAYFLVATDVTQLSEQVDKLQHLRFTHLLFESETIPDPGSQRFNVWLLDVAELSAQRATTGVDFLGWESREMRRNRRLIFTGTEEIAEKPRKPRDPLKPKSPVRIQGSLFEEMLEE